MIENLTVFSISPARFIGLFFLIQRLPSRKGAGLKGKNYMADFC